MKRSCLWLALGLGLILGTVSGRAVTYDLYDWAYNVDGTFADPSLGDPLPAGVDQSSFNTVTGLGTVQVTVSGAGNHFVGAYFNIDIDPGSNSYFNEYGSTMGTPAAGETWEIDEPGFVFGDIYDNLFFSDNTVGSQLDNSNAVPASSPDDVSMAIGWDFSLLGGETATINFILSDLQPTSGFYLVQTDPEIGEQPPYETAYLYFSSTLSIFGGEEPPSGVPDPGVGLAGLMCVMIGLESLRRRLAA